MELRAALTPPPIADSQASPWRRCKIMFKAMRSCSLRRWGSRKASMLLESSRDRRMCSHVLGGSLCGCRSPTMRMPPPGQLKKSLSPLVLDVFVTICLICLAVWTLEYLAVFVAVYRLVLCSLSAARIFALILLEPLFCV